jgi:hypothetical protein
MQNTQLVTHDFFTVTYRDPNSVSHTSLYSQKVEENLQTVYWSNEIYGYRRLRTRFRTPNRKYGFRRTSVRDIQPREPIE